MRQGSENSRNSDSPCPYPNSQNCPASPAPAMVRTPSGEAFKPSWQCCGETRTQRRVLPEDLKARPSTASLTLQALTVEQ